MISKYTEQQFNFYNILLQGNGNIYVIIILCTAPPPLSKKLRRGPFSIFIQGEGGGDYTQAMF